MAGQRLKAKIEGILREGHINGPNDAVYVLDGPDTNIHVVVVSPKFRGKRLAEKQDLILGGLMAELTKREWGRITLSKGVTPEELTATI